MAQTNYTPISLYYSTTASAVPTAANLVPGELAINTNDGKLYYEDSSGVVQVLATKSTGSIGGSNTQVQFNNSGSLGGSSSFTWDGTTVTATKFAGALNGTVGATTASTGAFTTLSTSSTTTLSGLTASTALALDASKNVVSVTNTGTGNNVLSASPTLTGTIAGASLSLSSLTSGRVTYAGASGLLSDSANLTYNGTGLGIGASASYKLDVDSGSASGSGVVTTLRLKNPGTNYGDGAKLLFTAGSSTTGGCAIGGFGTALDAADMIFYAGGNTEKLRLTGSSLYTASGVSVGIGTSSPSQPLTVNGVIASIGPATALSASSIFMDYNTTSNSGRLAAVGNTTGTAAPIYFSQYSSNASVGRDAVIIDSSGHLLVGTTSDFNSAFTMSLKVNSSTGGLIIQPGANDYTAIQFNNAAGTGVGSISVSSTLTSYNVTSDQRLKTNVVDAPIGNIDGIKVRSFDWIADGSHQEYGMVAQELIEIAPYAVTKSKNPDDMMQVDYSKLVPMMIKEIQDLKQRIATLENK